jgi:hypothetical protein
MATELTAEYLRSILDYDPATGEFRWKTRTPYMLGRSKYSAPKWNSHFAGRIAGSVNGGGYRHIGINGKAHQAHRLAWLYMTGEWPKELIDHRDCDNSNNRWENLREATNVENSRNARRRSDNKSGTKGVVWVRRHSKWRAQISDNGKRRYLGYFDADKLNDAAIAYAKAARELHGEFARVA